MVAILKDEEEHNESCGGTTSYKTADGTIIFLTQVKSCHHCGPAFENYSQLDFKCIIQRQEITSSKMNCNKNQGRKPRSGFELGSGHPLHASHMTVIHMKMCTPIVDSLES
jgi:hypothetical protein